MYPTCVDTYRFKLFLRKFFAKLYLTYIDEVPYSAIEFCAIIDDIIRDRCKPNYIDVVGFLLRVYGNTVQNVALPPS